MSSSNNYIDHYTQRSRNQNDCGNDRSAIPTTSTPEYRHQQPTSVPPAGQRTQAENNYGYYQFVPCSAVAGSEDRLTQDNGSQKPYHRMSYDEPAEAGIECSNTMTYSMPQQSRQYQSSQKSQTNSQNHIQQQTQHAPIQIDSLGGTTQPQVQPQIAAQSTDMAQHAMFTGPLTAGVSTRTTEPQQQDKRYAYIDSTEPVAPMTVALSQIFDSNEETKRQMKRTEIEAEQTPTEALRQSTHELASPEERRLPIQQGHQRQGSSTFKAKKDIEISDGGPEHHAASILAGASQATSDENTNALEAQMKEMFQTMRALNAKNPEMLSKLWQEERARHLANQIETARLSPRPPSSASKSNAKVFPTAQMSSISSVSQPGDAVHTSSCDQAQKSTRNSAPSRSRSTSIRSTWPVQKKAVLAAAAARLVLALPANQGNHITSSIISKFLDTNPSFRQFCHLIEGQGLQVDKSYLANGLLAVVPNIESDTQQESSAIASETPDIPKIPQRKVAATRTGGINRADKIGTATSLLDPEANPISGEFLLNTNSKRETRHPDQSNSTDESIPTEPSTPAKQGNHSKPVKVVTNGRTIEQLIDTAPAMSKSYFSHSDFANIDPKLEGLDEIKKFVDQPAKPPVQASGAVGQDKTTNIRKQASFPSPSRTTEQTARKRSFGDLIDLTLEISEDGALHPPRKMHADSTSLNRLPTPPETAEECSDLISAFKGEFSPIQKSASMTSAPVQVSSQLIWPSAQYLLHHPARYIEVVHRLNKEKAARRSKYNSRTIARDILLACGRHPEMHHLNAHLETLKEHFQYIGNYSDLSTLRWDLIDPGGPPTGSGPLPVPDPDAGADAENEDPDDANSMFGPPQPVQQALGGGAYFMSQASPQNIRHPKKRNDIARFSHPGSVTSTHGSGKGPGSRNDAAKPSGVVSASPAHASGTGSSIRNTGGYATLWAMQASESGEAPKRMGRPVGWRKWMQKTPSFGKPLGSRKNKDPAQPAPEPEPQYQVYKCMWRGCSAELHNLNTLRKHVHKLHGEKSAEANYICLWKGCGQMMTAVDEAIRRIDTKFEYKEFYLEDDWKTHLENAHLKPIAWLLGDGPTGSLSDHNDSGPSELYLSDSQGRRVTPHVVAPASHSTASGHEGSAAQRCSGRPSFGGLKKTYEEKARKAQLAHEKTRREIGPGIDRGGARLVNDKRRMGFVDEEFTTLVDNDDE